MAPNALRPLWKRHPWGVGWVSCYPNTLLEHREEITWEEELPLAAAVFSHGHSGLYTRRWRLIFGGQVMVNGLGGAMRETAACLSLCKWFRSAERGYDRDHELRAEQTTHSAAASSSCPWKAGREQAYPNPMWFTFWTLNHLLPGPTAGFRFCCWADLPDVVLAGVYNNESKTGSSFQGCLYAKKVVKA